MESNDVEEAKKVILSWDSTTSEEVRDKLIFKQDRSEVDKYLEAVDQLQKTMSSVSLNDTTTNNNDDKDLDFTVQIAMARLEEEFRTILTSQTKNLLELDSLASASFSVHSVSSDVVGVDVGDDSVNVLDRTDSAASSNPSFSYRSSTSCVREIDLISQETVIDLQSIARRMVASGCLRECIQVYGSSRKSVVEESFKKLGIERLSIGEIQRLEWEVVETKIRRWIRAAKVCVRILFASEKKLCEQVFDGAGTDVDDACLMESVKGSALQLFNFAEAISISTGSPEKLFKMLDLHDALTELLPDIEVVFESKSAESIRIQVTEILSRLGEAVRGILSEFEDAITRETSRSLVPGGALHPLTRYVMNYVCLISEYKQTLLELIMSNPMTGSRSSGSDQNIPEMDFGELEGKSPLAAHLVWIVVILQFNLEEKSKHYRDASLEFLFLMNNVHYIVEKAKGSQELREIIGDEYLKKLTGKLRQHATNYERSTWIRVLQCLRDEGLHASGGLSSGVSKTALRERFKTFNTMFEDVHRTQATWIVPDPQLRDDLRISISGKLIPAYTSFLGRFRRHIESGRHPENYIKYTVEDLEGAVLDFFEGNPVYPHTRWRSH